jgi:hypothetical protein
MKLAGKLRPQSGADSRPPASVLNRVSAGFLRSFEEEHAVVLMSPFSRPLILHCAGTGVWYTPPEIVRYMVARVDAVLRSELDLPTASPTAGHVLDPCCGPAPTVEVLRKIEETTKPRAATPC